MDRRKTHRFLFVLLLVRLAVTFSPLTCTVTRQHDGSFLYRLSSPVGSSRCEPCWEDGHNNVLARPPKFDQNRVQNLTEDGIVLKACLNLKYTQECTEVVEEVNCRVNCSSLSLASTTETPPRDSAPHWMILWACVGVLLTVVVVGLLVWVKRRSAAMSASYTSARRQV